MNHFKKEILDNICFTELMYGRINKKLGVELSKEKIEELIFEIIHETDESEFYKKGKNIYIVNKDRNVRLTVNSYTNRVITADQVNKCLMKRS